MNVFEDERASDGALDTNDFSSLIKGIGDGACSLSLSSIAFLLSFFFFLLFCFYFASLLYVSLAVHFLTFVLSSCVFIFPGRRNKNFVFGS